MKYLHIITLTLSFWFLQGCWDSNVSKDTQIGSRYAFTYDIDNEGWIGSFTDYRRYEESIYALKFSHATLPQPLNTADGAVLQSGINRGERLFMYMVRRIDGLDVNRTYDVSIDVEFAAHTDDGANQEVTLKAGATGFEPKRYVDARGFYRLNVDKGDQSGSGNDMQALGRLSNGSDNGGYRLQHLSNRTPLRVSADENGTMWVIVGTDSGIDAGTTIYYNTVTVSLE